MARGKHEADPRQQEAHEAPSLRSCSWPALRRLRNPAAPARPCARLPSRNGRNGQRGQGVCSSPAARVGGRALAAGAAAYGALRAAERGLYETVPYGARRSRFAPTSWLVSRLPEHMRPVSRAGGATQLPRHRVTEAWGLGLVPPGLWQPAPKRWHAAHTTLTAMHCCTAPPSLAGGIR